MKTLLAAILCACATLCGAIEPSMDEIQKGLKQAFIKQGADAVYGLVYPPGHLTDEIEALLAHKVKDVVMYPCDTARLRASAEGGLDWPLMPIGMIYVTTHGPAGADLSDAYFTVGLLNHKPVLLCRVKVTVAPEWRRSIAQ